MAKLDRNKLLANAQKLIQRGDLAKAVVQYEKLLEMQPKDVQSLLRLAGLYLRVDRGEDAVKTYMKAGSQYATTGFYQKAVAAYKQALQLRSNDPELMHELGSLYQQMGLKSPAVDHFDQAAGLYASAQRYDKAIEIMHSLLDLEPDRPDLKAKYGEYLFQAGRKDEAIGVFRGLVEILKLEGQWEDLARFYERILQMSPDDQDIGLDLAHTYLRIGLAPKALQRLKALFDSGVRDAEIFDLLARAYVLLGKNGKAVSAYLEKVNRLDRGSQADEIQKTHRRILEIDPTNEQALMALGEAEEGSEVEAEDDDESLHVIEESLNERPEAVVEVVALEDDEQPTVLLGAESTGGEFSEILQEASVYIRYGIKEKALKKLDQILAQDPGNVSALRKRIEVHRESDPARAIPDLVRLSEVFEGLGELDSAEGCIAEAKSIDENHPVLREFLGLGPADSGAGPGPGPVADVVGADDDEEEEEEMFPDADEFLDDLDDEIIGADDDLGDEFVDLTDSAATGDPDADNSLSSIEDVSMDLGLDIPAEAEAGDASVDLDLDLDDEGGYEQSDAVADLAGELGEMTVDMDLEDDDPLAAAADDPDQESAASESESVPYREELDQVSFFIETGLHEEARKLLAELRAQFGEQPDFDEQFALLPEESAAPDIGVEVGEEAEPQEDFAGGIFDLAKELEDELDFADVEDVSPGAEDVPTFEEIFDAFKKGVKETLSDEDADAHYDLGIAYMEMGIIDEGISEFEIAKKSPKMAADACNMIGIACTRKGDLDGAAAAYREGLAMEIEEPICLNLNYELALVLEELGEYKEALLHFRNVIQIDRNYRDIGDCLKRMKSKIEALKSGGGESSSGQSNVTYL